LKLTPRPKSYGSANAWNAWRSRPRTFSDSINAAARKVRKQITKDVAGTYTIKDDVLKDKSKGAPRLQTAKPGNIEAVIRSKGPVNDLIDFLTNQTDQGVKAKVLQSGGMKLLERGGAPAFEAQFSSTHKAIVQRMVGQSYTVSAAPWPMAGYDQN